MKALPIIHQHDRVAQKEERTLKRGPSERHQYAVSEDDLFNALDVTRVDVVYFGLLIRNGKLPAHLVTKEHAFVTDEVLHEACDSVRIGLGRNPSNKEV
ncbi:hypothetical protein pdam_00019013 [Pocillopora damicornis]|uniref:Uncharacterized protein n=1 Tax=Pocillopora damicornis TaxID=46731 RepID=A0A3M6V1D7_POCDA|nr:hypothetical protein pdam_00019013 [Pocillopora damicornis]